MYMAHTLFIYIYIYVCRSPGQTQTVLARQGVQASVGVSLLAMASEQNLVSGFGPLPVETHSVNCANAKTTWKIGGRLRSQAQLHCSPQGQAYRNIHTSDVDTSHCNGARRSQRSVMPIGSSRNDKKIPCADQDAAKVLANPQHGGKKESHLQRLARRSSKGIRRSSATVAFTSGSCSCSYIYVLYIYLCMYLFNYLCIC